MLNVIEATPSELGEYAKIPMSLLVESIFKVDIIDNGFGGFQLVEQRVKTPWGKRLWRGGRRHERDQMAQTVRRL